jgi:hypothetical protein
MMRLAAPLPRLALIYALSIPVALLVTPRGLPWEMIAALCAVLLVPFAGLAPWWLGINAIFLPALSAALRLDLSPLWALGALGLLALAYGAVWKSRVPLFFSSARAQAALEKLVPANRPVALIDLGCGDGRVLSRLAARYPRSRFDGVETAFAPWLIARLRCRGIEARCSVARADLWGRSIANYDIVYAYLSPDVMRRLWDKARREMRPGSLLVSAFAVPGVAPNASFDTGDLVGTRLHVWHMGHGGKAT